MTRDQAVKTGSKLIVGTSMGGLVAFMGLLFNFQSKVDAGQDAALNQAITHQSQRMDKSDAVMEKRLDRIERKVDRILERVQR